MQVVPARTLDRQRLRKLTEGDVGEARSFYFRGPERKLKLRAQNLTWFLQLAEGVDDETWLYHLREGDYSTWFRTVFQDRSLAEAVEQIERQPGLSAADSRQQIRAAVERDYPVHKKGAAQAQ